jgi:hypothetical protein
MAEANKMRTSGEMMTMVVHIIKLRRMDAFELLGKYCAAINELNLFEKIQRSSIIHAICANSWDIFKKLLMSVGLCDVRIQGWIDQSLTMAPFVYFIACTGAYYNTLDTKPMSDLLSLSATQISTIGDPDNPHHQLYIDLLKITVEKSDVDEIRTIIANALTYRTCDSPAIKVVLSDKRVTGAFLFKKIGGEQGTYKWMYINAFGASMRDNKEDIIKLFVTMKAPHVSLQDMVARMTKMDCKVGFGGMEELSRQETEQMIVLAVASGHWKRKIATRYVNEMYGSK